jgi:fibronectin-binding autotransporter adhesin
LTVSTGMTVGSGASTVQFNAAAASSVSITSNGKTFDFPVTFAGANGSTSAAQLNDALTIGSTRTTILGQGILALGANNLSTGIFVSSGASTRSITSSGGAITVTGNAATVLVLIGSGATYYSGMTVTASYAGSTGTRTFNTIATTVNISVTNGSDIVTFTAANTPNNLDFTGFSGSWSNAQISLASLTVSTGMTVGAGANIVVFSRTGTIICNGKTLDFPVTISGAGITTTIGDALTIGSTRTLTLTQGTLSNVGNYNVTTGSFSSSNTNARTLALGSGTWTVSGSGGSAWNCATSTNLTITGTGTISMTSASAKTFAGGTKTWPVLNNGGAGALTISGSNTFTTISNSVQPTTFTFSTVNTQTVTNFNVNGTAGNLVTINSTLAGTQATLSKASGLISVSYCSIQDSNATGGASWYAETSLGNVNAGNNTGWLFVRVNYSVIGDSGSYAVTGQAADLLKSKVVLANNGSYALAGQTATLLKTRILTADNGAYTMTGQTASLLRSKVVTGNFGVYTTTGTDATIQKSRLFTADPGFYAVTGQDALVSWSGAPVVASDQLLIKLRSFTERRRF